MWLTPTAATLVVKDEDGRTTHAHMIRSDVPVTLDGVPALANICTAAIGWLYR